MDDPGNRPALPTAQTGDMFQAPIDLRADHWASCWDSGPVVSPACCDLSWGGPPLADYQQDCVAHFDTPRGRAAVDWRCADGQFELDLTFPASVTADVVLPDGSRHAATTSQLFSRPFLTPEPTRAAL